MEKPHFGIDETNFEKSRNSSKPSYHWMVDRNPAKPVWYGVQISFFIWFQNTNYLNGLAFWDFWTINMFEPLRNFPTPLAIPQKIGRENPEKKQHLYPGDSYTYYIDTVLVKDHLLRTCLKKKTCANHIWMKWWFCFLGHITFIKQMRIERVVMSCRSVTFHEFVIQTFSSMSLGELLWGSRNTSNFITKK